MSRRLSILLAAFAVTALSAGAFHLWYGEPTVRPLHEAPERFTLASPFERIRFYEKNGNRTGWVLLPKRPPEPPNLPVSEDPDPRFLGAQACAQCHEKRYEEFTQTAHHRTSRLPTHDSILGHFDEGRNRFETKDPSLFFQMDALDDGFYQSVFVKHDGQLFTRGERIGMVTGSGHIAQTYLYWKGDDLYQLPISYFRETDHWINSPQYLDGTADFARPIVARCLSCHTTFLEQKPGTLNQYDKSTAILGISCERCHGPGSDHVEFHQLNPQAEDARHIAHPGDLSRQQLNDLCAQCHSGVGTLLRPPFSFRPGDRLEDFIRTNPTSGEGSGGVHTDDQLARLKKSICFLRSDTMTCATCHDPHQQERGDLALFSRRCMRCHQPEHETLPPELNEAVRRNCIDCHMPKRHDRATTLEAAGEIQFPLLRDHFIAIWPEATDDVLQRMSSE